MPCGMGPLSRNTGLTEGDSAYNKRHYGAGHCKAKRIPFGCFVDYLPTPSAKEKVRLKELDNRTRHGMLVGFQSQPGGRWSGDYFVVDWEHLQSHPHCNAGAMPNSSEQ